MEAKEAGGRASRQDVGIAQNRSDRGRSLDAMRALESMAGRAAPGRDEAWRAALLSAIAELERAIEDQRVSYADPTSLMAQVAQDQPHLRTWVRQLHHRWDDLARETGQLRERMGAADSWSTADVREQVRWLMSALHHHRAREADIVFDALGVDLGSEES